MRTRHTQKAMFAFSSEVQRSSKATMYCLVQWLEAMRLLIYGTSQRARPMPVRACDQERQSEQSAVTNAEPEPTLLEVRYATMRKAAMILQVPTRPHLGH